MTPHSKERSFASVCRRLLHQTLESKFSWATHPSAQIPSLGTVSVGIEIVRNEGGSMKRYLAAKCLIISITTTAAVLIFASDTTAAGANGVTEPAFYVDGQLYRTVNTPTDLSRTRAPDFSFDTIYDFGGLQPNVATAAPGDPGYNGGRWRVRGLEFDDYEAAVEEFDTNDSGDLDSFEEVAEALEAGAATDIGVIKSFVCPVIKVP
jgi:hypothetical protein